jgi:hypothetical protein
MSTPTTQRTGIFSPTRAEIPQRTLRTDAWWFPPLIVNIGLAAFIIYATVGAFWGSSYWVKDYHYLTPFYSPCISASCAPGASHLGVWLGQFPAWIPLGMLVLPFLLAFRITCYYYRKASYRSVWQVPHQLRNPRAARPLHRRNPASADHPEQPPVPLLHRLPHRVHQHLRRDHRISLPVRLRVRFGQHHSRGQRAPAVVLRRRLPFMPTPHWRPTQALLQTPAPVLALDESHLVQRTAHAVRVDHPGHAGTHRLLHHAGRQRHHQRSEIHWLTANPPATDDELAKHPGRRS